MLYIWDDAMQMRKGASGMKRYRRSRKKRPECQRREPGRWFRPPEQEFYRLPDMQKYGDVQSNAEAFGSAVSFFQQTEGWKDLLGNNKR